jgi:hypothetical protein
MKKASGEKRKKSDGIVVEVLDLKTLEKRTGLSEFLLKVVADVIDSGTMTLIDFVVMNPDIRPLDRATLENYRDEYIQRSSQKRVTAAASDEQESQPKVNKKPTDDDIRKFIVKKREEELSNAKVLIAGTSEYDKMSAQQRDEKMVAEFVAYAQTNHGYFIYVYYVGPSEKGAAFRDPQNWLPVHKNHLIHFHKRLRNDLKAYYTDTKYDQRSFKDSLANPAYDPRFIAHKWLQGKETGQHKALIASHRHLLQSDKDFVTQHYEAKGQPSALHYYDANKEIKPFLIDLVREEEDDENMDVEVFNVEQDRLRQQALGYRLTEEELSHVTIEEFPPLSRKPLPSDVDCSFDDLSYIAQRVYIDERTLKPPEFYQGDPMRMIKPLMMALNQEALVRRTSSLIGDKHIQILEADNIEPFLDYIAKNESCIDEVKQASSHYLYALMATELMSRDEPHHITQHMSSKAKKDCDPFVLLQS